MFWNFINCHLIEPNRAISACCWIISRALLSFCKPGCLFNQQSSVSYFISLSRIFISSNNKGLAIDYKYLPSSIEMTCVRTSNEMKFQTSLSSSLFVPYRHAHGDESKLEIALCTGSESLHYWISDADLRSVGNLNEYWSLPQIRRISRLVARTVKND